MLRLAGIKSSDIFYDLGCGDASILVLAVKEFDVKKAIGVEDDLYRNNIARKRVKQEKLQGRISVDKKNMYETDLTNADVIFDMLVENTNNMRSLYSQKIKNGTSMIYLS
jgi:predicted RNA methylase